MKKRKLLTFAIWAITAISLVYAGVTDQQERTKTFTVQKGGTLEVNVNPGDILVNTWEKDQVVIKVKGMDDDELKEVEIKQSGNKISVSNKSHWGWTSEATYVIEAPVNFNIEVKTSAGDIVINGNLKGYLRANSAGGDVEFKNVDGDVKIYTAGGDIETGNVTGDLKLNTQGGDIVTGAISGKSSEVSTMGGDIQIKSTSSGVEATTYGGDIQIGDIGGNAKVITYGGDIQLGKVSGSVKSSTYGGNIELESASGQVEAETYGGNLSLKKITGSVNAKTQAGNVYVELNPSGNGKSSIQSNAGEVMIALPSTAKATINAEIRVRGWWDKEANGFAIESDFPAKSSNKSSDDKEITAEYVLNGGGAQISVKTINSSIKISKSK